MSIDRSNTQNTYVLKKTLTMCVCVCVYLIDDDAIIKMRIKIASFFQSRESSWWSDFSIFQSFSLVFSKKKSRYNSINSINWCTNFFLLKLNYKKLIHHHHHHDHRELNSRILFFNSSNVIIIGCYEEKWREIHLWNSSFNVY